jgi:hypothetical protein
VELRPPHAHVHAARNRERVDGTAAPPARFLPRAWARLRSWRLDRALISGADPRSSPLLAARAAQLTSRRNRERLAARVEGALEVSPGISAAIQPPRVELEAARSLLTQVGAILRSDGPIYCQGIARLRILLSEGGGPLYHPTHPGELSEEAESIVGALEGRQL